LVLSNGAPKQKRSDATEKWTLNLDLVVELRRKMSEALRDIGPPVSHKTVLESMTEAGRSQVRIEVWDDYSGR